MRVRPPLILLGRDTFDRIVLDAARHVGGSERGGILLGLRRGPHLQINEATMPMPSDRGARFSFLRSAEGHQDLALARWTESGGIVDWVGEWHSHPEARPSPSGLDVRSWRSIVRQRAASMAFVIAGYDGVWVGLMVPGRPDPLTYWESERSVAGVGFAPVQGGWIDLLAERFRR